MNRRGFMRLVVCMPLAGLLKPEPEKTWKKEIAQLDEAAANEDWDRLWELAAQLDDKLRVSGQRLTI